MIAVIADDITGAAEVAGIAWRYGLRARLLTHVDDDSEPCDVLVVATDTRSMPVEKAMAVTAQAASALAGRGLLFRKTDSALRGHVTEELRAMMQCTGADGALYVPANPSRGRIIRQGTYLINGKPIDETDFSFDPEYPARTARMTERFPEMARWRGESITSRICYADAECTDDMRRMVERVPRSVLLAGAADLFSALLAREYPQSKSRKPLRPRLDLNSLMVVCGSTLSKPIPIAIETSSMPRSVYDRQAGAEVWIGAAQTIYARSGGIILTIGGPPRCTDPDHARWLRTVMGATAAALIRQRRPKDLIIEGGATAFTLLQTLGWSNFQLSGEIASGVVRMQSASGTYVTLKPGSYDWGNQFSMWSVE